MHDDKDASLTRRKIDDLNAAAFEIRVSDSNRAFELSDEALAMAEEADYARGKAEALRTKGFCYMRLSKNAEAQTCCEESIRLYETLQDLRGQGYLYTGFGIIQRNTGNYKAALELFYKSLELLQLTQYHEIVPLTYYHIGITYKYIGNLEAALENILKSHETGRQVNSWITEAYTLSTLGSLYDEMDDVKNALEYHHKSHHIRRQEGDKWGEAGSLNNIGHIYLKQGDYDKAKHYCEQSFIISQSVGDKKGVANSLFHLAQIAYCQSDYETALKQAQQSLRLREEIGDKKGEAEIYQYLAEWAKPGKEGEEQTQQQLQFFQRALALGELTGAQDIQAKAHQGIFKVFKQQNNYQAALAHLETFNALEKEIHSQSFNQKILNIEVTYKVEQSKKEAEIYRLRNVELANLYEESKKQKEALQTALNELKATQTQLIQREKMASLGELTAGIAHEIQNPLNFVTNFSEANKELIAELQQEIKNGNYKEAAVIAADINANEGKINHHGRRADNIVKGMLQHARTSTGEKEFTDINQLVEEHLRLAYHGYRAKDQSFYADLSTYYDPYVGQIAVVPQEIGRVLLNLFSNAFYAVHEKKQRLNGTFESIVSVTTEKKGNQIVITVKDNGSGMPPKVAEKVFQPFFTTKPTGEGTGLGLSLSYDIVTKGHGGSLSVTSQEGKGSEFAIELPMA